MKVYQVIECNNSYGEYNEYIIGTYLSKNKAIAIKHEKDNIAKAKRVAYEKCQKCYDGEYTNSCYVQGIDDSYDYCENEVMYDDIVDSEYEVREFEVIE